MGNSLVVSLPYGAVANDTQPPEFSDATLPGSVPFAVLVNVPTPLPDVFALPSPTVEPPDIAMLGLAKTKAPVTLLAVASDALDDALTAPGPEEWVELDVVPTCAVEFTITSPVAPGPVGAAWNEFAAPSCTAPAPPNPAPIVIPPVWVWPVTSTELAPAALFGALVAPPIADAWLLAFALMADTLPVFKPDDAENEIALPAVADEAASCANAAEPARAMTATAMICFFMMMDPLTFKEGTDSQNNPFSACLYAENL
jgi:hypothetical protein